MVWICSECKNQRHNKCESKWSCDCKCNINGVADATQKIAAIDGGIVLAAGGLALTVCTGGLGAVLVGGAMLGAGISSTFHGASKLIKQERIDGGSYAADVTVGAVTGLATGGIGAGGEAVATNLAKEGVKIGVTKLAVRTATGAVAGVAAKTIDEVKVCATTDKKWEDFGKNFDENGEEKGTATAWVMGAAVGAIGGASTHVTSNLSKPLSSGVTKAATRVAVSGTTAVVSDATIQGVNIATGNQDEYDVKQTLRCATTSAVLTAAQEGVKNAVYAANGGRNNMLHEKTNKKLIKETVSKEHVESAMDGYKNLKEIPQSTLNEGRDVAETRTNWEENRQIKQAEMKRIEGQIQEADRLFNEAKAEKNIPMLKEQQQIKDNLQGTRRNLANSLHQSQVHFDEQFPRQNMNSQNAHFLDGERFGQVAVDVGPSNGNMRGPARTTFDYHVNDQGRREFRFSGYTDQHNYDEMPGHAKGPYEHTYARQNNNLDTRNNLNYLASNQTLQNEQEKKKKKKNKNKVL
jgi:hypothetical protein